MTILFLLALITPIIIGFLILLLLIPDLSEGNIRFGWLWKLFLAPGIGFAIVSMIHFLWITLLNPKHASVGLLTIEFIILIILTIASYLTRKQNRRRDQNFRHKKLSSVNLITVIPALVFIIVFFVYLSVWQKESFQTPFGDWDAWAIWNLRAGFLASGTEWLKGFSPELYWSHLDYPLLLPLNVARLWVIQGDRSVLAPIILGLIYQLSLVGLLSTAVKTFKGNLQGIIAGILGVMLLFVSLNFKLYADIPIAYYFLAANALLFFASVSSRNKPQILILAGFLAGATLWTKNEGWAFLIAIVISKFVLDMISRNKLNRSVKWWAYFLLGLAPLLFLTIYFKIAYAPPGDILAGLELNAVKTKLFTISRYWTIFRSVRGQITNYGNLIIPMLPLLAIYGVIVGISFPKSQAQGILFLFFRVLFLVIIYFFVYLLTPNDLTWHLNTSIERLVTHIMPSFLLLYFLVVSPINGRNWESESSYSLDWPRLGRNSK